MTIKNEQLDQIVQAVCRRELGRAMTLLENYLFTYASPKDTERLNRVKTDYRLMVDYWQRGYQDPERQAVYQRLLQSMFTLSVGMVVSNSIRNSSYVLGVYKRARSLRQDWSVGGLRHELENFVSERALLELKPDGERDAKATEVYVRHHQLLSALFDYIWTSKIWGDSLGNAFIELLLSPTIDSTDQQLLVSAIMLSLLNCFDYQKFRVLTDVYRQSADQAVRQRALVGWALGLDSRVADVYPELRSLLSALLADSNCRRELTELQMQLVYCLKAEEDSHKIQQEMIPELIKNNGQFKVTRDGIEEIDENSLEDILHPEASEQRMEQLERTMARMADMQRAGSDIYFGGFSQMKRFPFFSEPCNWFMPFSTEHPALRQAFGENQRYSHIIMGLLRRSPFCDSDAYSFALGFHQALDRLPKNVLSLLERGELSLLGDAMSSEHWNEAPFVRRRYLQDIYRFFRLFPSRSVFGNPFDTGGYYNRPLFFTQALFRGTPLEEDFVEVAVFLVKKGLYEEALQVLRNSSNTEHGERYYLTLATVLQRHDASSSMNRLEAISCYRRVLGSHAGHEGALRGLARALFLEHDYQGALDAYEELLLIKPEHHNYLLNKAVCLGNLSRYDEALAILYKMNYEQEDDLTVRRVLAWTLVGSGKEEQASRMYSQLLDGVQPEGDDLLNYGLCQWLMGDIVGAAGLFKQYADSMAGGDAPFDAAQTFFHQEVELLHRHGISDVEIRLMIDLLN